MFVPKHHYIRSQLYILCSGVTLIKSLDFETESVNQYHYYLLIFLILIKKMVEI